MGGGGDAVRARPDSAERVLQAKQDAFSAAAPRSPLSFTELQSQLQPEWGEAAN